MSEKSMDLNGLPKAIRKTGRLRHPVKQLNTVTPSCGENPAAVEQSFRDLIPVSRDKCRSGLSQGGVLLLNVR